MNAVSKPDKLDAIGTHADSLGDPDLYNGIAELRERFEILVEEIGQESKFRSELYDYVKDLRAEAKFINTARLVFGGLAIVVCLFCLMAPICICIFNFPWFASLPEYPRAALIVAMIAAGVLILQNLVKSVYRSAAERQADEFIPPQVKLIHELTSGGKGG